MIVEPALNLVLCSALTLASPAQEAAPAIDARPPAVADPVESVFDMNLDAPPPPPPDSASAAESPAGVSPSVSAPVPSVAPSIDDASVTPTAPVTDSTRAPKRSPLGKTRTQQAGGVLLISGLSLAAIGGVFLGFSERERYRTQRISLAFDLYSTEPRPLPDEIRAQLDASRRNRVTFGYVALGFGVGAGAALVTGAILWAIDGHQRRRHRRAVSWRPDGLQVSF